jgi:PAS domain S-box-containing protein
VETIILEVDSAGLIQKVFGQEKKGVLEQGNNLSALVNKRDASRFKSFFSNPEQGIKFHITGKNESSETLSFMGNRGKSRIYLLTSVPRQSQPRHSSKFHEIFDVSNQAVWAVNKNYELTFFNSHFKNWINSAEVPQIGTFFHDLLENSNKVRQKWEQKFERAFTGRQFRFELITKQNGSQQEVNEVLLSPVLNDNNEVVEVAAIAQDVTFKKAAERKLRSQAAKIQSIFDSSANLIWSLDSDFRLVSYNKVFAEVHQRLLKSEVSIGSDFIKMIKGSISSADRRSMTTILKNAFKGKTEHFVGKLHAEKEEVWMETFLSPIQSHDDEVTEISCMAYDVTAKMEIEKEMRNSIREKEILLQEVHHRVKNNLQIISSILNLQSSYVDDDNTLSILRESQNRIKSMSFIHESLYQTKDFSGIEFTDYILSLAKNLIHSYSVGIGHIKLKTDFEKIFLSLDQAITCGLIANEIISNSIKYAFEEDKQGEINISVKMQEEKVEIKIGDNGKGLPQDFDFEKSESLGLQLVYTLADQLDASIEVNSKNGTNYLITFIKQ